MMKSGYIHAGRQRLHKRLKTRVEKKIITRRYSQVHVHVHTYNVYKIGSAPTFRLAFYASMNKLGVSGRDRSCMQRRSDERGLVKHEKKLCFVNSSTLVISAT